MALYNIHQSPGMDRNHDLIPPPLSMRIMIGIVHDVSLKRHLIETVSLLVVDELSVLLVTASLSIQEVSLASKDQDYAFGCCHNVRFI